MDNDVASSDNRKLEPQILGIAGAVLLALASFFVWQELALAGTVLAIAGAACAAGFAWFAHSKEKGGWGPAVLAIAGTTCAAWYAATREPIVLIGLGITFIASVVLTALSQRQFKGEAAKLHRMLSWFTTALGGLATSFATYFFVFDATESSLHGFIARRSLLTLSWLGAGVAMVVMGKKQSANEVRDSGFLVLGASMAKLLFYDLGHTDGLLRIGALALGGLVLVAASRFTATTQPAGKA
jgi:hypothetical protein